MQGESHAGRARDIWHADTLDANTVAGVPPATLPQVNMDHALRAQPPDPCLFLPVCSAVTRSQPFRPGGPKILAVHTTVVLLSTKLTQCSKNSGVTRSWILIQVIGNEPKVVATFKLRHPQSLRPFCLRPRPGELRQSPGADRSRSGQCYQPRSGSEAGAPRGQSRQARPLCQSQPSGR